jgi:hypothetical protein
VPRQGLPTEGEVRFVFPSGLLRVRCSIERPALPAAIRVTPSALQIWPSPLGRASGSLACRNEGETGATVSLHANPSEGVRFEPAEFDLAPGREQAVQVFWQPNAGQAEHLQDWLHSGRRKPDLRASGSPGEYLLEWRLDGERGGFIPLEVIRVGGLARAVAGRLRRAAAGYGLGGQRAEDER